MSEVIENLGNMPDEQLETVIDFFPELSLLAQLILEERQKRESESND